MKSVTLSTEKHHTLDEIRAGFVIRGGSLHKWCKENNQDMSNVRRAIAGTWKGPKAKFVLQQVYTAAGFDQ